jgi:hypothetical protein
MDVFSLPVLIGTALAVLVGVSLGLLGGGGSILTVPILVYVIGLPTHEAIAASLLVVGTTSLAALVPHARAGRVRWRTGAVFGATSMVGAFVAAKLARYLPAAVLLLSFGAMMLVTAAAMMRKKDDAAAAEPERPEGPIRDLPLRRLVTQGLGVGAVTGLIGSGGGFLIVPALVLLAKLPMRAAVGTSLLVIAMNASAAFVGHATSTPVDVPVAAMMTTAAVLGSFVGSGLAGRVPQALLRRGFAWFVVVMAVFILSQEVPKALGYPLELSRAWPVVLGLTAVPIMAAGIDLARRARSGRGPAGPRPDVGDPRAAAR